MEKTEILIVEMSQKEKDFILKEAERSCMSVSEYIVLSALSLSPNFGDNCNRYLNYKSV